MHRIIQPNSLRRSVGSPTHHIKSDVVSHRTSINYSAPHNEHQSSCTKICYKKDANNIKFKKIDENYAYIGCDDIIIVVMKCNSFVNATEMCQQNSNKNLDSLMQKKKFDRYVTSIATSSRIPKEKLIIEIKDSKHKDVNGLYFHQNLILSTAYMINADFKILLFNMLDTALVNKIITKYRNRLPILKTSGNKATAKIDIVIPKTNESTTDPVSKIELSKLALNSERTNESKTADPESKIELPKLALNSEQTNIMLTLLEKINTQQIIINNLLGEINRQKEKIEIMSTNIIFQNQNIFELNNLCNNIFL